MTSRLVQACRPVAALLVVWGVAAAGEVVLTDGPQLESRLKQGAPCCVLDARSDTARALLPLQDAVVFRPGLAITPTAAVVVIADDDDTALAVGRQVASDSGAAEVLAVKGGVRTWRTVRAGGEVPMPITFIIPKNTCEQGKPIQELKFDRQ